jgi:hypothetical protein
MNALHTTIQHVAPRAALVMWVAGASRSGVGAANAPFAPVCTGF